MRTKMMMAVACLGAAIGSAQTMHTTVKVNFSNDTQVGKVSLPAGKYSIKELTNSVIEISSGTPTLAARHAINAPTATTSLVATTAVGRSRNASSFSIACVPAESAIGAYWT